MLKYLKIWVLLSANSFQSFFVSKIGAVLFLIGKVMRFVLFLGFLIILMTRTKILAGYTLWQVFLFYLTFNFIDAATQMLFREVYRFRQQIISGSFDLILVKPVNVLFRLLFGGTDLLDLLTLFPFLILIGVTISKIPGITILGIFVYLSLVLNAFVIALSFHIFVLALAILTTEIDHAIMIYRDFLNMGRVPVDIYQEPLRSFITFVIPVGVMVTFPVKALLGNLLPVSLSLAFIMSASLLGLSLLLWYYALRKYTSVSS